jgi:hypothetical protein
MLKNSYRLLLYTLSLVILISGIVARKDSPLALPTAAFMSICVAAKSGSKHVPAKSAIIVATLMTVLTLVVNVGRVGSDVIRDVLTGIVVGGGVLLIFLKGPKEKVRDGGTTGSHVH